MPKNKFQDAVFTAVMATVMVYGMVLYNVILNTRTISGTTFLAALSELPIMVPIAFALEFLFVGKLAKMIAFKLVTPDSSPKVITAVISLCICMIMCPLMSLIATCLFKGFTFSAWFTAWSFNILVAVCWQLLFCGPAVRALFRRIFK